MFLLLLGVAALPFSVAACGGDDGDTAAKGNVVKVELGE